SLGLSNTNTFPTGTGFSGPTFAATAGAFTLSGNSIALSGNITDNSVSVNQTINLPLVLNTSRLIILAPGGTAVPAGNLVINGGISGSSGGLTLKANNLSLIVGNATVSGVATLSATSYGTLVLGGPNTYAGPTVVQVGR